MHVPEGGTIFLVGLKSPKVCIGITMPAPLGFHFGIGFGGRRDLGLGSIAGKLYSLDSSLDSRMYIYICTPLSPH